MSVIAILAALPPRFWLYGFPLTFMAGLMTGAARLPWWSGAVAGFVTGGACIAVVVVLRLVLGVPR